MNLESQIRDLERQLAECHARAITVDVEREITPGERVPLAPGIVITDVGTARYTFTLKVSGRLALIVKAESFEMFPDALSVLRELPDIVEDLG